MPWATQGRLTNPSAGAIVADTGALPAGTTYYPQVVVSSTATAQLIFQRRNAGNTVTISEQLVVCPANQTFQLSLNGNLDDWADNERFRVVLNANVTGSVQGSIFW